jgi:hypothetical protein
MNEAATKRTIYEREAATDMNEAATETNDL